MAVAGIRNLIDDYGAAGDGATDDLAAFNNAIAAAAVRGDTVYLPPRTYAVSDSVFVPDNVTIAGGGPMSVIKSIAAGSAKHVVYAYGNNNITLRDFAVDGNNKTNNIGVLLLPGVQSVNNRLERLSIYNTTNNSLRASDFTNLVIDDCDFQTIGASIQPAGTASRTLRWSNCRASNMAGAGPAMQILGNAFNTYRGVTFVNNTTDVSAACTPVEITGCTSSVIEGNTIIGAGTRGYSLGWLDNTTVYGNTAENQTGYFVECNQMRDCNVVGNTSKNCDTFLIATGASSDVLIEGNHISGGTPGVTYQNMIHFPETMNRCTIRGNDFKDCLDGSAGAYVPAIIRTGSTNATTDIVVADNEYYATSATAILRFATVRSAKRVKIMRNSIVVSRNAPASRSDAAIWVNTYTSGSAANDVMVMWNDLTMLGTNGATEYRAINKPTNVPGYQTKDNILVGRWDY